MSTQQNIGIAASTASTALSTPAIAAGLGLSASTAAWIAGPIIGGIAMATIMYMNRKGPKQKVATTAIVNDIEPILAQNRDAFLNGDRSAEHKEFALKVFEQNWNTVLANCNDSSMGKPGQACIKDRQRGGQWDWFKLYYDPIVQTEVIEQQSILNPSNLFGSSGGINPWVAIGLIGIAYLALEK